MFMANDSLLTYIVGLCLGAGIGASVHALCVHCKEHEKYELGKSVGRLEGHLDAIEIISELHEEEKKESE